MKFSEWLRPGIKVKRWILLGIMGIMILFFAVLEWFWNRLYSSYYIFYYIFLILTGIFVLYITVTQAMKSIIGLINKGYLNVSLNSAKLENLIYEKRLLVKGPKIVVIGGGTGLSTMLRGLKYYTSNITAIVTVADDGGGSGELREDLGILPPGDIRNCILALADTEPLIEELLQYRFTDGKLKNQSFGNLFLAAMDGISDNFNDAVQNMCSILAVEGRVIPVTLDNLTLKAKLKNGKIVEGESNIPIESINSNSPIDYVSIMPEDAKALSEAVEAIRSADAVIIGPGSLYTSILPNILIKGIGSSLHETKALKLYVSNIMTQRGETDDYGVEDHIRAIYKHGGKGIIDYVIVNIGTLDSGIEDRYLEKTSSLVKMNEEKVKELGVEPIEGNFIQNINGLIRHESDKLSSIIIETIMEKKLLYDRKKIIEYFYLSERLKDRKVGR
ncbi:MAG TPA: gluconeogenesis factor YvcK family protein [Clostridiaceae bacterium]